MNKSYKKLFEKFTGKSILYEQKCVLVRLFITERLD